jgi:hypothetical protein
MIMNGGKVKQFLLQVWIGPEGSRLHDSGHVKVVRLSALRTGRLYPNRQEMLLVLMPVRA